MKVTAQPGDSNLLKAAADAIGFLVYAIVAIAQAIYRFILPGLYQRKKDIRGEIALVTGGGGGLGRLLALRLAKLGATVVLWDVNAQGLEESVNLMKGIGGKAIAFKCDLADKEDVYRTAKKTQEEVGDVTILINNAGVVSGQWLLDTPDHLIQRTFNVNVIAHFWTVKAFLPKMIEKDHGHIVTIASMAGFIGVSKLVDYCSSKYAAVGFDESLRMELDSQGVKGVRTTVICPYFIQQTGMFDNVASRFLPTLKSNDVADRIVEAIRREEIVVMIPGTLKFGIWLKTIMPWSLVSSSVRNLVPDACPHGPPQVRPTANEEDVASDVASYVASDVASDAASDVANKSNTTSLSSSVTKLNQRLVTAGKNL